MMKRSRITLLFGALLFGAVALAQSRPANYDESKVPQYAPRPVYTATAEQDCWGDPRGSFVAAKAAELVYKLFKRAGLGVDEMPPVEMPVGDFIGFHNRKGSHGLNEYDWEQFLNFAGRQFGKERVFK